MGVHVPVLYQEVISGLQVGPGGRYIDGTVGLGGHTSGLLEAAAPDGMVLCIDRDPQALYEAQQKLAVFGDRALLKRGSYLRMGAFVAEIGWEQVDGVLLDLGISSLQLERPERGFSFREAGPLDMRFDPDAARTADDIVNSWEQEELANVLFQFGEERQSRRIARALIEARPIRDTQHLADVVAAARRGKRSRIHPATRTFQALRIAVNGELEAVREALPLGMDLLRPGGRMAVIAFHSLEDRIVKQTFRQVSREKYDPADPRLGMGGEAVAMREITRKPIRPSEAEVISNPRSRSARLRIIEKM